MNNWETYKLGDLVNHKKGFAFKSKDYTKNGIPVIRVSDLTEDSVNLSECHYLDEGLAKSLSDYSLYADDIIITTVGSWQYNPLSVVGKVVKVPVKAAGGLLNQNAVRFRAQDKSDQVFLYYRLKGEDFKDFIISGAQGSANQASITLEQIFNFSLKLPTPYERKLIAEILSALDDKIELNRRMNQTLEQMAQILYQQYFKIDIDEDNLPEGWQNGKIGDIIEVKGGTTPSTKQREFWDGDIHWTSPKDLSGLRFPVLFDTEKKLTPDGLKKVSSGLLPVGTLLLSSRAPIGYLAITQIPVAINQGYIAILCNKEYSNLFMLNWLKENMNIIIQNANGSTFLEISKSVFKNIDLKIPPVELVKNFDNLVRPLFDKIVSNEKEIIKLIEIRNSLLPKLMSGEIDVMQTKAEELYEPVLS